MINSFSKFLVEETKLVYFTFGRMNPPTIGHEKLLIKLAANARTFPYRVYLSQSQDKGKNPLQYKEKIKIARKMFPKHARQIIMDSKIKNVFDVMTKLYDEGFRRVVMVVGSDRINEFDILLNKYNGKKGKHGFYNFERIQTISAGERDPDADGAEGMSASKMRAAANKNDFTSFSQGLPKVVSNADAKFIYNSVRKGLGLKEEKEFKNHIQLEPVSNLRESYVNGKLFNVGDQVVMKENGEIGTVKRLGSNYVIIEGSGKQYRKWLDSVERVEENNNAEYETASFSQNFNEQVSLNEANMQRFKKFESKDTHKTKDGRTAKKGLWYNINQKRKRGEKPAKPGDKDYPKTLDIEAVDHTDVAKKRIDREKMTDKMRHDRMMDRARMSDTVKKNKETK
jgi:hypothetical protein